MMLNTNLEYASSPYECSVTLASNSPISQPATLTVSSTFDVGSASKDKYEALRFLCSSSTVSVCASNGYRAKSKVFMKSP